MTAIAVTMVRDELDVLPWTLAWLDGQVDHIIVADNGSTDGTREWLEAAGLPSGRTTLTVTDDPEVGYWQARKMTRLAGMAGEMGATWVVPFDADEAWRLPDDLETMEADILVARPYVYVPHTRGAPPLDDPEDPDPTRFAWRLPAPEPHGKVIFRWRPGVALHMGNHGVTYPGAHRLGQLPSATVRHYQYRSLDQVRRKVRQGWQALNAAEGLVSRGFCSHWGDLARLTDDELAQWWEAYTDQLVVYDP